MADKTVDHEALRQGRVKSGTKLSALAKIVGYNAKYLGRVELGVVNPSIELAYALSNAIPLAPERFILAERKAKAS